jgi:integrase
MARITRDSRLEAIDRRLKLRTRKEPYWRQLIAGTSLGYRRNANGGTWVARYREGNRYREVRLGMADDFVSADSVVVYSYSQAVKHALSSASAMHSGAPRFYGDGLTVNQALDAYFIRRKALSPLSTGTRLDEQRAARSIRPEFGCRLVNSLNTPEIDDWLTGIASTAPSKRSYDAKPHVYLVDLNDAEVRRRRTATANRTLNTFRAALNHAWRDERNHIASDLAWRRIRPLKLRDPGAPKTLSVVEIRKLLDACADDLRAVIEAALLTGARYGEIAELRVKHYLPALRAVHIYQFKTGKTLLQPLTDEGVGFFARHTFGKAEDSLIFTHHRGKLWKRSDQTFPMQQACRRAGLTGVSFKTTRATYGKLLLLATGDLELVAKALGHSDTRITRKHYAQYLPNEVAQAVRKMPALGICSENVEVLNISPASKGRAA